ncbi:hypothetical protein ACOSQ3_020865 [Xanthoceras sorbifolium]
MNIQGGPTTVACFWGPQVSPMCCTLARAWRTPNNSTSMFLSHLGRIFWFCSLIFCSVMLFCMLEN